MPIYALGELAPDIHPGAFVHPDAIVIGAATIHDGASIWPAAVIRADYGPIDIGGRTSIQDGTVVHTTADWPTVIGARCVVGHNAHLEGCVVGDDCLIGSGSIVLNRARVEAGAAVGSAALLPEGTVVARNQIALGVPALARLAPPELRTWIVEAVALYEALAQRYAGQLRRVG